MSKLLQLNDDEYSQLYTELCDLVYRDDFGLPGDDMKHTSSHARKLSMDIMDKLEFLGYLTMTKTKNRKKT